MPLARFAGSQPATTPAQNPQETCELCSRPIAREHSHLVDVRDRRLLCACGPCAVLFTPGGAAQGRYKTVPRRYTRIDDFNLDGGTWDQLAIPVDLVYLFYSTPAAKVVAFYPSPAGAMESLLPLAAWDELMRRFDALRDMEADTEALLVRRTDDGSQCGYIVPIDACYELVGLIRLTWKGFDGGDDAHRQIERFFGEIEARC